MLAHKSGSSLNGSPGEKDNVQVTHRQRHQDRVVILRELVVKTVIIFPS